MDDERPRRRDESRRLHALGFAWVAYTAASCRSDIGGCGVLKSPTRRSRAPVNVALGSREREMDVLVVYHVEQTPSQFIEARIIENLLVSLPSVRVPTLARLFGSIAGFLCPT